jgi:uncharacterized membrane protein YcaP (DUF421 family)
MRKTRISKRRLLEETRLKGHHSLDEIEEARLEKSGHISILFKPSTPSRSTDQAA